ncbi:DUF6455 family protein [Ovoidimarina sediminis]|uniref:DUF6455 family protein n=1 Tax=Ovoidimarina sediminis TaxID=3079856 RepID=UPI00397761D7
MYRRTYQKWSENFDRRMTIRRRVMNALGISLPRQMGDGIRETLKQTLISCATCDHVSSCADWLSLETAISEPPGFCPNKERFKALLKKR